MENSQAATNHCPALIPVYLHITSLVIIDGFISYNVVAYIELSGVVGLILQILLFSVLFNAVFVLATFKTKPAQSILSRVKNILSNRFAHRK